MLRAASVVCFAAICSAKIGIFRIFLTNVLDTVLFGVVNFRYLGSVGDVRIWGQKDCGGWPGDAWSSNLLSSASLVSNKINIGPVRRGTVAN